MFKSVADLVSQAQASRKSLGALMLSQEAESLALSEEACFERMMKQAQVMRSAVQRGLKGLKSHSGMTGGDAKKLDSHIAAGTRLLDQGTARAISYAIATGEVNAAMGLICAAPTAGASGVLPGVLLYAQEKLGLGDEDLVMALFAAGAIGYVIANNAFISGAQGGCQAEIGSASAMAAAAATEMAGGSPEQAAQAAAMALKGLLGLSCDPLAGLVEVPCIKRNAVGTANALTAAEMALAGIQSKVPCDEVIEAMHQIGLAMPPSLKETAEGGLAATATGREWKRIHWIKLDDIAAPEAT